MGSLKLKSLVVFVLLICLIFLFCKNEQKYRDHVILEIDTLKFTLNEIDKKLGANLYQMRFNVIKSTIDEFVFAREAFSKNLTIKELIDKEIINRSYNINNQQIDMFLGEQNIDFSSTSIDLFNSIMDYYYEINHNIRKIEYLDSLQNKYNIRINLSNYYTAHCDLLQDVASFSTGNNDSGINFYYIFDYHCYNCIVKWINLEKLIRLYRDDVKFHLINYSYDANYSTKAAMASGLQGKFWEMHNLIMNSGSRDIFEQSLYIEYAKTLNLDLDKFHNDLKGEFLDMRIKDNFNLLSSMDIYSTPSFILNGRTLSAGLATIEIEYEIKKEILYNTFLTESN
jgi:predicted DsbA family dithiol-disulfide isomerase